MMFWGAPLSIAVGVILYFVTLTVDGLFREDQENLVVNMHQGILYNTFLSMTDVQQVYHTTLNIFKKNDNFELLTKALVTSRDKVEKYAAGVVGVVLFMNKEAYDVLEECAAPSTCKLGVNKNLTTCAIRNNCLTYLRTLKQKTDAIFFYNLSAMPPQLPSHRNIYHLNPALWWRRIHALQRSPFNQTLMLDLDAQVCSNFHRVFDILDTPSKEDEGPVHVVDSMARAPYGGSCGFAGAGTPRVVPSAAAGAPAPAPWEGAYARFGERNLGALGLRTGDPAVRALLARFEEVFVEQMRAPACMDTPARCFRGDQTAWREALFMATYGGGEGGGNSSGGTAGGEREEERQLHAGGERGSDFLRRLNVKSPWGWGGNVREVVLSSDTQLCRGAPRDCMGGCMVSHKACKAGCQKKRREMKRAEEEKRKEQEELLLLKQRAPGLWLETAAEEENDHKKIVLGDEGLLLNRIKAEHNCTWSITATSSPRLR